MLELLASHLYHIVWYPRHAEYNEIERNSAGLTLVISA